MTIYDFTVKPRDGSEAILSDYSGKVFLVVNTATSSGTSPRSPLTATLYRFLCLDIPL